VWLMRVMRVMRHCRDPRSAIRDPLTGQFGLIPNWDTAPSPAMPTTHAARLSRPNRVFGMRGGTASAASLLPRRFMNPTGEAARRCRPASRAVLTINANKHRLMNQFYMSTDEKRMVVILPEKADRDWLEAPLNRIGEFLAPYPADPQFHAQKRIFTKYKRSG
jgi:hypothetical protein